MQAPQEPAPPRGPTMFPAQKSHLPKKQVKNMSEDELNNFLGYEDVDASIIKACLARRPQKNPVDMLKKRVEENNSLAVKAFLDFAQEQKRMQFVMPPTWTPLNKWPDISLQTALALAPIDLVRTIAGYFTPQSLESKHYLHTAASLGRKDAVEHFVATGLNVNSKHEGKIAAERAAKSRVVDILVYLLQLSEPQNPETWQTIAWEILHPDFDKETKGVLECLSNSWEIAGGRQGPLINVSMKSEGMTLLHLAAKMRLYCCIDVLLLNKYMNPFVRDPNGKTVWEAVYPKLSVTIMYDFIDTFRPQSIVPLVPFCEGRIPTARSYELSIGKAEDIDTLMSEAREHNYTPLWLKMEYNNDIDFSILIAGIIKSLGFDERSFRSILQFQSQTFLELFTATYRSKYREPSCNVFKEEIGWKTPKIVSIVVPYFNEIDLDRFNKYRKPKQKHDHMNTHEPHNHEPRTLDESYYVALNEKQLTRRDGTQVISKVAKKRNEQQMVLAVSQLWIWQMDDVVVSSTREFPDTLRRWSMFNPANFLESEIKSGETLLEEDLSGLQLVAILFSECINFLDRPCFAGLKESVFITFEKAVADIFDDVQIYMREGNISKIHLADERDWINDVSDIREELVMIKKVIEEQEEVWNMFLKILPQDTPKDTSQWRTNTTRIIQRPTIQISKYKSWIEKIDRDAARVEGWIQSQLGLKVNHASLRESHNSTILSLFVIGFTLITFVFTPLSFMTSLFALADVQPYRDLTTSMTVGELVTLIGTGIIVWLSFSLLRYMETLRTDRKKSALKRHADFLGLSFPWLKHKQVLQMDGKKPGPKEPADIPINYDVPNFDEVSNSDAVPDSDVVPNDSNMVVKASTQLAAAVRTLSFGKHPEMTGEKTADLESQ